MPSNRNKTRNRNRQNKKKATKRAAKKAAKKVTKGAPKKEERMGQEVSGTDMRPASPSPAVPSTPFQFMQLPLEIRHNIYEHVGYHHPILWVSTLEGMFNRLGPTTRALCESDKNIKREVLAYWVPQFRWYIKGTLHLDGSRDVTSLPTCPSCDWIPPPGTIRTVNLEIEAMLPKSKELTFRNESMRLTFTCRFAFRDPQPQTSRVREKGLVTENRLDVLEVALDNHFVQMKISKGDNPHSFTSADWVSVIKSTMDEVEKLQSEIIDQRS